MSLENTKELKAVFSYYPEIGELSKLDGRSRRRVILTGPQARTSTGSRRKSEYARVTFNGRTYPATHIIWAMTYGHHPKSKNEVIDHINGNTHDNRLANLRLTDRRENALNHRKQRETQDLVLTILNSQLP